MYSPVIPRSDTEATLPIPPGCVVEKLPSCARLFVKALDVARDMSSEETDATVVADFHASVGAKVALTTISSNKMASCANTGVVDISRAVLRLSVFFMSLSNNGRGPVDPWFSISHWKDGPSSDGSIVTATERPLSDRAPRSDRVITSAGLLTCGSVLGWAFPWCDHSGISSVAHRLQLRGQLRIWVAPHRIPFSSNACSNRSDLGVAGHVAKIKRIPEAV